MTTLKLLDSENVDSLNIKKTRSTNNYKLFGFTSDIYLNTLTLLKFYIFVIEEIIMGFSKFIYKSRI